MGMPPRQPGIYRIMNLVNRRQYVGSAVDLYRRRATHFCELRAGRHPNQPLQAAWNKYGAEALRFEALAVVEVDELLYIEQELIELGRRQG
jgi:group I intron endonuclease